MFIFYILLYFNHQKLKDYIPWILNSFIFIYIKSIEIVQLFYNQRPNLFTTYFYCSFSLKNVNQQHRSIIITTKWPRPRLFSKSENKSYLNIRSLSFRLLSNH